MSTWPSWGEAEEQRRRAEFYASQRADEAAKRAAADRARDAAQAQERREDLARTARASGPVHTPAVPIHQPWAPLSSYSDRSSRARSNSSRSEVEGVFIAVVILGAIAIVLWLAFGPVYVAGFDAGRAWTGLGVTLLAPWWTCAIVVAVLWVTYVLSRILARKAARLPSWLPEEEVPHVAVVVVATLAGVVALGLGACVSVGGFCALVYGPLLGMVAMSVAMREPSTPSTANDRTLPLSQDSRERLTVSATLTTVVVTLLVSAGISHGSRAREAPEFFQSGRAFLGEPAIAPIRLGDAIVAQCGRLNALGDWLWLLLLLGMVLVVIGWLALAGLGIGMAFTRSRTVGMLMALLGSATAVVLVTIGLF